MKHWWAWNHEIELGDYTKNNVEDLTGCIPLFLKNCVVEGEKDEKKKIKLDDNTFFSDIYTQVIAYEQELQERCASHKSLNRYVYYNRSTHITSLTSLDILTI